MKTHFRSKRPGRAIATCGRHAEGLTLTRDRDAVTCQRCRNVMRGQEAFEHAVANLKNATK